MSARRIRFKPSIANAIRQKATATSISETLRNAATVYAHGEASEPKQVEQPTDALVTFVDDDVWAAVSARAKQENRSIAEALSELVLNA